MKNYVVQTLCKINKVADADQQVPMDTNNVFPLYQAIQKQSSASVHHFLEGEWEYVLLEEEVTHVFDVFKQNFQKIYDLWNSEPCNILFLGLDSQILKPTEIIGKFDKFMMFNYTDPKTNSKFTNNFNCDVRYYPATMDKKWMDYTIEKMDSLQIWEDEQNIYNDMLWGQDVSVEEVLHPHLAFQGHMMPTHDTQLLFASRFNGISFKDANIVHWHSSRGVQGRLDLMTQLNQKNNVED